MNIFNAELYEAAVVVQPLIGTLVYYSNDGQYRPRLAQFYSQTSNTTWEFILRPNLLTEDGEKISPMTFADSLKRSIKIFSKKGPIPVLSKLRGYKDFITGKNSELHGVKYHDNKLIFEFESPVRSGLLQILSFAPFGFISATNFDSDGNWADDTKIVSSGPYRLSSIEVGKKYVIEKNPNWNMPFKKTAPHIVTFTHDIGSDDTNIPTVFDSARNHIETVNSFERFPLVPEYLNPILLGNLKSGLFSSRSVRRLLFSTVLKYAQSSLPERWEQHIRSTNFYDFDVSETLDDLIQDRPAVSGKSILIEGSLPTEGSPEHYAWQVLRPALEELGIKYEFAENPITMQHIQSEKYDIRMRGSSVGGGIEVWGINILFCSDLGVKFPDPTGKICSLVNQYENFKIDENDFKMQFYQTLESDLAILPISQYGNTLFLSKEMNSNSLKPTLNVVKFDQLEL